MHCIVCVDEKLGMAFNKRRQSQDRVLRQQVAKLCKGKTLWLDAYSYKQFAQLAEEIDIKVDEVFLEKAGKGDFCFVERDKLSAYERRIESLILYQWNRIYPADLRLDLDLNDWKLVKTRDFEGASHEKITELRYKKR